MFPLLRTLKVFRLLVRQIHIGDKGCYIKDFLYRIYLVLSEVEVEPTDVSFRSLGLETNVYLSRCEALGYFSSTITSSIGCPAIVLGFLNVAAISAACIISNFPPSSSEKAFRDRSCLLVSLPCMFCFLGTGRSQEASSSSSSESSNLGRSEGEGCRPCFRLRFGTWRLEGSRSGDVAGLDLGFETAGEDLADEVLDIAICLRFAIASTEGSGCGFLTAGACSTRTILAAGLIRVFLNISSSR